MQGRNTYVGGLVEHDATRYPGTRNMMSDFFLCPQAFLRDYSDIRTSCAGVSEALSGSLHIKICLPWSKHPAHKSFPMYMHLHKFSRPVGCDKTIRRIANKRKRKGKRTMNIVQPWYNNGGGGGTSNMGYNNAGGYGANRMGGGFSDASSHGTFTQQRQLA